MTPDHYEGKPYPWGPGLHGNRRSRDDRIEAPRFHRGQNLRERGLISGRRFFGRARDRRTRSVAKHRYAEAPFYQDGDVVRCELKAAPAAPIEYTTDGSNALANGGSYEGPFLVPAGARYVIAVADGGESPPQRCFCSRPS